VRDKGTPLGGIIGAHKTIGLFPGQGSEHREMFVPLRECLSDELERVFGRINALSGRDILGRSIRGALDAQLAVFGTGACYWEALSKRFEFDALLGHSLGFYTALYASGSIGLDEAIGIIIEAQRAIEEISNGRHWEMAAIIGLKVDECEQLCKKIGGVFVANINSASQAVISGKADMVNYLLKKALEAGALSVKTIGIPYPLHSPFMKGIKDILRPFVLNMDIKEPIIPVFDHTEGGILDRKGIIETLAGQLEKKVLWKDTLLKTMGKRFIEIGPSSVLSKLVRWIDRDAEATPAEEIICKEG